jgi:Zn-finger nucleic acid-binding protein
MAAAAMSCPKCDQPLERFAMQHGVFWRCGGCSGVAIGLEVLRRTFVREQINAVWRRAREEQGSPAAACPSCRNQMIEVAATEHPKPRIEICRLCHFLWFDAEELNRLTPLPPKPPAEQAQLSAEARQALALAEVEIMARAAQREGEADDRFLIELAWFFASVIR